MSNENEGWFIKGTDLENPNRLKSCDEMIDLVKKIGFLPLFHNEILGFSVEERTLATDWWTGKPESDPWTWREIAAKDESIAYGKFFNKKAGFIAKEWFPYFANYRRDGYDFDARWEDGIASYRQKRIMDVFQDKKEMASHVLKEVAGFGKGGLKNYSGIVTELQMQTYLIVNDFRRKVSKKGLEYGMAISIFVMPEEQWGYDFIASAYQEEPEQSRERITKQLLIHFPDVTSTEIEKLIQ